MKNYRILAILCTALLCGSAGAQESSSYYNLPKGAFAVGMTENSGPATPEIYMPHLVVGSHRFFSTTGAGAWWSKGRLQRPNQQTYSYANIPMKKKYSMPQLVQEGKVPYQYGSNSREFNNNLFFYVGDSVMHYLTPARFWTDLVTQASGYKEAYGDNYYTINRDVMGAYFNNISVMYIDGISIPISYGYRASGENVNDLFPLKKSHVVVTIYKADSVGGRSKNKADRTQVLWKGTLTKADFTPLNDVKPYRGALNVHFDEPLIIDGPFMMELSDMGRCNFYVFSSKGKNNRWGFYMKDGEETYPGGYCLAVSVHAMFPALCQKEGELLDVIIPASGANMELGNCPTRTIYANCKYEENANGWSWSASPELKMSVEVDPMGDYSTWTFSMDENTTGDVRTAQFTINFRGKSLTYNVMQLP